MTLELYDLSHTRVTVLKNHKDASVESELSGDKTLSFLWHQKNKQGIPHEYYLRTDKDEFVVKENSKSSNGYRKIVAKLNLETIEGRTWREFIVKDCTAEEAVNYALTDTGWTCKCTVPAEHVRNISMTKVNSYEVLEKVQEAFTCEMEFDTFNKVVKVCEQVGSDKGAYFIEGLNLKELTDSGDTYDYATIIIPIGADDLSIESVNGGNNYLENYQYSSKKKSVIWEDSSYTDPKALMDDARYKLNEISKPKRSFRAQTIDLARLSAQYSALEYSVGDVVTIVSGSSGIREKQRITKTVEYLENPAKNTCDISNTVLSFEDLQKKLFAAAECIDNITTDNGTVKGSSVDSIDVTQIIGLERYIAEDIDDLKANYLYVKTEFGTPYAVIGKAILTTAETTNLKVTGREDVELSYINELHVQTFEGDTATFKTVEADNIAALEARVNKITGTTITAEYLEANYAKINFANVEKESVGTLLADIGLITDATIVDGHVTGYLDSVGINANTITAGTLAVDRLVIRGNESSIIYEINNISGALQAQSTDTLNGEVLTPRTITADRIVAGAITANEIAAETITADKIVTRTITANKIATEAITANEIAAGAITTAKIEAGAVTAIQMAAEAVTAEKIAVGAVTADKIAVGAVIAGRIASGAVTTNKIAAGAVTADKISVTSLEAIVAKIGGFTIGSTALYNGTTSIGGANNSVYIGTNGISCGQKAVITAAGIATFEDTVIRNALYGETNIGATGAINMTAKVKILSTEQFVFPKYILYSKGSTYAEVGPVTVKTCCTTISSMIKIKAQALFEDIALFNSSIHVKGGIYVEGGVMTAEIQATKITATDIAVNRMAVYERIDLANTKYLRGTKADGTTVITLLGVSNANTVHVGNNDANTVLHGAGYQVYFTGAYLYPNQTNKLSLGKSDKLWTTVYAKTGTINTSDRNKKHDIHYFDDEEYSRMTALFETLFLKCRPSTYIFNDGDRVHIGAISQDFEEIMNELGITAQQFAGFCKDVRYDYAIYNEDGTPVEESKYIVTDAAGNVVYDYALRYQEFIFLTVHMVQRLWKMAEAAQEEREKVELKVSDLKDRMEFLEKAVYGMSA